MFNKQVNCDKNYEYSVLIDINENHSDATGTSNFAVSSVCNSCEAMGTALFRAGKWIINHPVQSALAGTGLFAMGLMGVLGIPMLIREGNKNVNAVNCSLLSDNVLHLGANKGVHFSFEHIKGDSHTILAELSGKKITDTSHIYLNTTHLCQEPEDILSDSFILHCKENGGAAESIKFESEDLIDQAAINKKLNGTACSLDIEPNLLFKGELQLGKQTEIKVDAEKMCSEGKIHNFQLKTMNKKDFLITVEDGHEISQHYIYYPYRNSKILDIDISKACEKLINKDLLTICTDSDGVLYPFTPSVNLTAGNVKKLTFGGCTVTDSDSSLPHKILILPLKPLPETGVTEE